MVASIANKDHYWYSSKPKFHGEMSFGANKVIEIPRLRQRTTDRYSRTISALAITCIKLGMFEQEYSAPPWKRTRGGRANESHLLAVSSMGILNKQAEVAFSCLPGILVTIRMSVWTTLSLNKLAMPICKISTLNLIASESIMLESFMHGAPRVNLISFIKFLNALLLGEHYIRRGKGCPKLL